MDLSLVSSFGLLQLFEAAIAVFANCTPVLETFFKGFHLIVHFPALGSHPAIVLLVELADLGFYPLWDFCLFVADGVLGFNEPSAPACIGEDRACLETKLCLIQKRNGRHLTFPTGGFVMKIHTPLKSKERITSKNDEISLVLFLPATLFQEFLLPGTRFIIGRFLIFLHRIHNLRDWFFLPF